MEHFKKAVIEKHAARKRSLLNRIPGVKWYKKELKKPSYKLNRAIGLTALGAAPVLYGVHQLTKQEPTPPSPYYQQFKRDIGEE